MFTCVFYIIAINKPTNLRVVVSALQVVELGFGIVIITSISERVNSSNIYAAGIADYRTLSPCVVGVSCDGLARIVGYRYYITLQVLIEIICSSVIFQSANCSVEVIEIFVDILRTVTIIGDCFLDYIRSVKRVFVKVFCVLLLVNLLYHIRQFLSIKTPHLKVPNQMRRKFDLIIFGT